MLLSSVLYAQSDTVIAYDARSHKIIGYYSVPYESTQMQEYTSYNYGTEPGFSELSLSKPDKTPLGSGFTDILPAHQFWSVTNYPIRTAVKIYRYVNDSLAQVCSGTLIGRNLVLTAEHCLCTEDTLDYHNIYFDSLYVIPAFDNKLPQGNFGGSVSWKYYFLKSGLVSFWNHDIAMIELEKPLGDKTGWMGIGYTQDDNFFKGNVFHKFSYPAKPSFTDTTRIYNGDTLYYNYGIPDIVSKDALGYGLVSIRGQSGSSIFYTDNKKYYIFGVLNTAYDSRHKRIENSFFYSFKQIIDNLSTGNQGLPTNITDYRLYYAYPNPFNPSTTIRYSLPEQSHVELKVYDMLGREVTTLVNKDQPAGTYNVFFDGSSLPSGMYIYKIKAGEFSRSQKLLLIK